MANDSWTDFTHDPLAVHFIHRNLAYVLTILIAILFIKTKSLSAGTFFSRLRMAMMVLVVLQVVLGIATVLTANNPTALLWLGVSHQFVAMMLLLDLVAMVFVMGKSATKS